MDRKSFFKLLRTEFFPLLKEEGFRGSGTTLRRIDEPLIHVVNVQGSYSFSGCYINLGAHISSLPTDGGGVCVPASIKEYQCFFRDRLDPPQELSRGIWPYLESESEARGVVSQIVSVWAIRGHGFFEKYSAYPDDYRKLVGRAIADPPHPREALKLAMVAKEVGMRSEALTIARRGLETASPSATALTAKLSSFVGA